jgi:2-polyprenyl-6-methoxyphenol hydroxylase-like FAD-dependent oxidoreductase
MAQRNGDGSVRVYICLCVPKSWARDYSIDFNSPLATRDGLIKNFVEWDDELKDLIKQCDDEGISVRPLYTLPAGYHWALKPNITLIGDAAHLMTPFAGQGVNLAMLDALLLCEAIVKNKDNLEAAIGGFADLVRQYMPNV